MNPIITIWPSQHVSTGTAHEIGWPELFRRFETAGPYRHDIHPGWAPAQFADNHRAKLDVQRVYGIVFDVDGNWNLDSAAEAFAGCYGFLYVTKGHTADIHRFRIVLPFGRGVSGFEYYALWSRIAARHPGKFDPSAKDPSRFWGAPCQPLNGTYEYRALPGMPLDPDAILAEPEPANEPALKYERQDAEERARLYLETIPGAVSGQGGSATTWRAACVLARGFALSEERTYQLLKHEYNPRCQPTWTDKELRHKAKQAVGNSRLPHGYLLLASPEEPAGEAYGAPPVMADCDAAEAPQPAWKRYGVRTVSESLQLVYESCKTGKRAPSVSTGCEALDWVIGGYRPEMVTVLGAVTNWGKSGFALRAFNDANEAGKKALYVAGEDSEKLTAKRLMAMRTGIDGTLLRDEEVSSDDLAKMVDAVAAANHAPWFLNGIGRKAEWVAKAIAELCAEEHYELVICDYLQAWATGSHPNDRRNEVRVIAGLFGDAVKNGKAAGLFLSQLRRPEEASPDWRPTKFHLKEAGDIENKAEHVVLGYTKGGKRMVYVDKNKDTSVHLEGIALDFNEKTGCFNRC